jgi:hypothetical protein
MLLRMCFALNLKPLRFIDSRAPIIKSLRDFETCVLVFTLMQEKVLGLLKTVVR